MKSLIYSLSLAVTLTGLLISPSMAQVGPGNLGGTPSNNAHVCTNSPGGRLNLRAGAGQQYQIVTQIHNGASVQMINTLQGNDGFLWHHVSVGNTRGWVRGDYLCNSGSTAVGGTYAPSAYVCTRDRTGQLNIRSGAGQNYKVTTRLPNGTVVRLVNTVQGQDGMLWHQLNYGNGAGWARGDYLCE